jgi:osmoprotectant transport system ATP-binding protein
VRDVSLKIESGEWFVLLGSSGSGKTTLLKMINRLLDPLEGRVEVDNQDISKMDPVLLRRSMGYVLQNAGLFPHWTVEQNVTAVLRLLDQPSAFQIKRAHELLLSMELDPKIYASRYPSQLSGGQRQRVGVARALAADPP